MFNQSNENNNKSSINEIMQFVPLKNVMQSQNVDWNRNIFRKKGKTTMQWKQQIWLKIKTFAEMA